MKEELPKKCVNCGESDVVYHHIVPLCYGGTNNISNITPLCDCCHKAVHFSQNIHEYRKKTGTLFRGGRPKNISEDYQKQAIHDWFNLIIGTKECKRIIEMKDTVAIQDNTYCKEYKKQNKIVEFRNNIDVIESAAKIGRVMKKLGYIRYEGDEERTYFYAQ